MNCEGIWKEVCIYLEGELSSLSYLTWIKPLTIHFCNEDEDIILLAWNGNIELIDFVNKTYKPLIEEAFMKLLNRKYSVIIKATREYKSIKKEYETLDDERVGFIDEYLGYEKFVDYFPNQHDKENGLLKFDGIPTEKEIDELGLIANDEKNEYYSTLNNLYNVNWRLEFVTPYKYSFSDDSGDFVVTNTYIFKKI